MLAFFFTVVPNASRSGGTGCPASRSTLMSSPARALSDCPLKKVCETPAPPTHSASLAQQLALGHSLGQGIRLRTAGRCVPAPRLQAH